MPRGAMAGLNDTATERKLMADIKAAREAYLEHAELGAIRPRNGPRVSRLWT